MNYPLLSEYQEAVMSAEDNFAELSHLRPVLDTNGKAVMTSGNFAAVFKMRDKRSGRHYAVKCFLKEQEGRAEAYRQISDELEYVSSSFLTTIKYLDRELFVDSKATDETEFPVVLMDWVEGVTLDKYIYRHIDSKYELSLLAHHFSRLAMWLILQPFAHGDLKPDNIIVRDDGTLVLVDYDGMYVPAMKGQKARELGSPDFRHPNRNENDFDEHIDDFSLISILLSLKTISVHPELVEQYSALDRLLFPKEDCCSVSQCQMLKKIFPSEDLELNILSGLFVIALEKGSLADISFKLLRLSKPKEEIDICTNVTEEELANAREDEPGVKYSFDSKKLLEYYPDNKDFYSILPSCKVIANEAFKEEWSGDDDGPFKYGNELVNIVIPDGVEKIGDNAFVGCWHVVNLVIPQSVKSIGVLTNRCFVWLEGHTILKEIGNETILVVKKNYIDDYKKLFPRNRVVVNPYNYPCTQGIRMGDLIYDSNLDWVIGCVEDCNPKLVINKNVIGIAPNVFRNSKDIIEVVLPEKLLYIGEYAFSNSSINTIVLPNNILFIGDSAFERCKKIIEVDIPRKLVEIRRTCFSGCSNLKSLHLPNFGDCRTINSGAFSGTAITELKIPYYVRVISEGAFRWCHKLSYIDICSYETEICNNAFVDCESLEFVFLSSQFKLYGKAFCFISEHAFGNMPNLKLFYINTCGVETIPYNIQHVVVTRENMSIMQENQVENIFKRINEKKDFMTEAFPVDFLYSIEDNQGVKYSSDKKKLLYASKPLNSYVIPEGTEVICSYAFQSNSICSVVFPNSLKKIGDRAFACCSLRCVDLRNTQIKNIGEYSFLCDKLETIFFPNCLEVVNKRDFKVCKSLKYIYIPECVKVIDE